MANFSPSTNLLRSIQAVLNSGRELFDAVGQEKKERKREFNVSSWCRPGVTGHQLRPAKQP